MDIYALIHKKAFIFTVISKYFVCIFNFANFQYFMSLSQLFKINRSRAISDKLPVIYREKLPSYKLQKKDIRPTNQMFPHLTQTRSASKHIKNKNNLVQSRSESSDVKKLRHQIENKEIQIQKTSSLIWKLHGDLEETRHKSQNAAQTGNMVMANYFFGLLQETGKQLTNLTANSTLLENGLHQLKSELHKLLQEKKW